MANTTAQRLIEATIERIESHGVERVTVRAVAERAEANVAAVSYHFGSKDALIAAALEGTIRHTVDDSLALLDAAEADATCLWKLFDYYLEGARRYPRITRAHLRGPLLEDAQAGPFPTLMRPVVARLEAVVAAHVVRLGRAEAAHRARAAFAAALFPALLPVLFEALPSLEAARRRQAYARHVADTALRPVD